jgi:glycosyltransferase involved in cell wall biosynthesis
MSFVITSAGSLDEANGFLILLKAFSLLQGDQYRLCMAGAGPLEQQVREAAANDPRIDYLGMLPFSEVLQLYKRSDVLINMRVTADLHTKYFFPSKMMEYLASGVPVISTCTGHVREEFGDFCYLLEEETPEGLAEMIRAVAQQSQEERKQRGQRARHYMMTNKTWQAQTRKVVRYMCETVLGIPRRPAETPEVGCNVRERAGYPAKQPSMPAQQLPNK